MLSSRCARQHRRFFNDVFPVSLRRLIPLVAVLGALGALASACGGSSSAASTLPAGVVAEVGGQPIYRTQIDQLLTQACANSKANKQPCPTPGSADYKDLQGKAVAFVVQNVEYDQEARKLGVGVTEKQIDAEVAKVLKQSFKGNRKKLLAAMKKAGLTMTLWRFEIRASLTQTAVANKVTKDVKVTKADIEKYYETNAEQYVKPATRKVRHILVPDKKTAEKLYGELEHGADFAKLAKKYSTDPASKSQGGKLTITKGQTVAEFDKVAFSLPTGKISKPVHTQYGWHIIQALANSTPPGRIPLKQVESAIKQTLEQQKRSSAFTDWQKQVENDYKGKVKYASGFEPVTTTTAPATPISPGPSTSTTG